jgi:hypothetical protein
VFEILHMHFKSIHIVLCLHVDGDLRQKIDFRQTD